MKKSRIVIAVALAIVLVITCANMPTFSWFSRPHNQDGAQTILGGDTGVYSINAFNGKDVTIKSYSSEDGYTYSETAITDYNGSNIPNNNRKYFRTTITNESGAAQNVSLYARTLSIPTVINSTSNGTLALGVNSPTRSYRDYSELATDTMTATRDAMRIYFQKPKNNPVNGWTGTEFYICWNEDTNTQIESLDATGSNGTYYKMTYCGEKDGYYNYYADIPKTATHAFFAVENWGTNNNGAPNYAQRTQTLWNLGGDNGDGQTQLQSKVYQLTSTVSNGNTQVYTPPYSVNGACINHYYSSIFVATGGTYEAGLNRTEKIPTRADYSANYIGSLEYYSGNENVFTVNKTTGEITGEGEGEAILYTKAIGSSYSDAQQVETTVHVTADASYVFNDVPIVKNLLIPGEDGKNVVDVDWYVINNSTTNALTYTIDEVYLGL